MKKAVVLFVIATISSFILNAQQTHFGLKGGLNLSSVDWKDGVDFETKPGIHIGGLAHIHVAEHFAIQPELVFSMQGGKQENDFKFKTTNINIPVLFQYMTNDGFRLQTGPQIGFLLKAETEYNDAETTVTDDYKTVDFAWTLGASYLFKQGIGIDARYNLGITDFNEASNVEFRNRVFQVGLFYQFMHKRK